LQLLAPKAGERILAECARRRNQKLPPERAFRHRQPEQRISNVRIDDAATHIRVMWHLVAVENQF